MPTSGAPPVRDGTTDAVRAFRHAAPLAERHAYRDARPDGDRLDRARERWERWRQAAPFGRGSPDGAAAGPAGAGTGSTAPGGTAGRQGGALDGSELWRRRLAAAGLDEAGMLAVLAADGGPEPDWAADLLAAYGVPGSGTPDGERQQDRPPEAGGGPDPAPDVAPGRDGGDGDRRPDQELPFVALAEPLVTWARRRLHAHLDTIACDRLPPAGRLTELLLRGLRPRLNAMVQRTCLLELAADRAAGRLAGRTPEERFASFQRRLRDPRERYRLLIRYPVLARQLAVTGRAWVHQAVELVTRLAADLPDLVRTFSPDRDPGGVVDVVTGLGDPHRGARTVAMVRFASGPPVVYKPRPSAVDRHFQDLLAWVNARTSGPRLRVLRCLDRGSYGWMEYVESAPPADPEAARRFHRRQGALLALLYLLHAGDFHAENLVQAGDQPVLVDLETLLQPELPSLRPAGESGAERLAADLASGSVLHAGLLPTRPAPWGGTRAGMAGPEATRPHRAVVRLPTVVASGTDRMRIELAYPDEVAPADGPSRDADSPTGADVGLVRPREQVEQVVRGFTEVYHLLAEHRDELAAPDGPLAAFASDEVRVLVRDTMTYAVLLSASFHPSLLVDGLDRERHLDRLWSEAARRPGLAAVIEAERRDLWQGDVPVFRTGAAGGPVRDSRGVAIPDLTVVPGLRIARDILARLGPADLARQTWLIRACLAVNGIRRQQRFLFHRYPTEPAATPAPDARIADAASGIADQLAALAVRDDGGAAWIGAQFGFHRTCAVGVLGPGLHDGLLGIALFLARHADLTGDRTARRLARDTVRTAVAQVRRGLLGRVVGLCGLGGAVYALSHLGALWADDRLLAEAADLAEDLGALLPGDTQYEVMEGTAGALFGLVARHHAGPSGRLLDLVRTAADHLVAAQRGYGSGASWLPAELVATGLADRPLAGFGHGTSGVAAALLAAAELLGDDTYRMAAARGFDYERDLFDPGGGYWRDIRDHARVGEVAVEFDDDGPERARRPVAWCHGSPGVGMSRLWAVASPGVVGSRVEPSEELSVAIADTLREGFGNGHSLCHGDLGSLDFLQLAADRTGDPLLRERVRRQAATTLDAADRTGWHCGLHRDIGLPGLLTGLAGIGYGLLRLLAPDRVPSVLAQEPPR